MNGILYVKRLEHTASAEVSADVILPDYLPEVRRVTGVQAMVTCDGKYLSGEELEADGNVTYTVLYTTPDGTLAQISETSPYTGRIPIKSDDDRFGGEDIVLSASAENVNCRVTAPRKLTLSSRVRLRAVSEKPADGSLHLSDAAGDTVLRRKSSVTPTGYMTEVKHSGEAEGEIREREGMKLISAVGNICVNDARIPQKGDGKSVLVKGDAVVTMLLLSPEGTYVHSRGRVPFEEEIGIRQRDMADGYVIPAAFAKVVMLEVDGSADGIFTWKAEYDIDCVLMHGTEADLTVDAYISGCDDTLSMEEFGVCSPAAAANGRLTTSAAVGMRPECTFVTAWGNAWTDKAETDGNRVNISGSAKICAVTVGGGEFFTDEVTIPWKYSCEAVPGCEAGDCIIGKAAVDVCEITARTDGNTVNLTAELFISAAVLIENTKTAAVLLTPSEKSAETGRNKSRIRIYVPDESETAWDVEKKFRLGRDAVKEGAVYVI